MDWETRQICKIMNTGIENGDIKGWRAFKSPKRLGIYGTQRGWERIPKDVNQPEFKQVEFVEITEDMDIPF